MEQRYGVFADLFRDVLKPGICAFCGACVASCPASVLELKEEVVGCKTGPGCPTCVQCQFCYHNCPMVPTDWASIEELVFGHSAGSSHNPLGHFLKAYAARTTDEGLRKRAASGGFVTELIGFLLDEGLFSRAVVAAVDGKEPWKPAPRVVSTREEALKAAGSKYTPSPNLSALPKALGESKKVAFVGVPCQIRGLRKMRSDDGLFVPPWMDGAEILAIGLFCMESFHYDGLIRKYFPERGIDVNSVTSFRIKKGRLIASGPDGELLKVKLRELDEYVRGSCKLCTDFASELADISVGDVGSEEGWSTVLVRTKLGEKVVERLIASGRVEVKDLSEDDLTPAAKLAQTKKERHAKKEG